MKIKSARETCFLPFFRFFFTGAKPFSRALFSRFSRLVQLFTGTFWDFSRVRFKISRAQNQNFSREGYIFHGQNFRNEIKKKNYNFDTQNTKNLCKKRYFLKKYRVFSRALLDFSRAQFLKYFTCTNFSFTGRNLF